MKRSRPSVSTAMLFDAYERLWYHCGMYEVSQGKTGTYPVEADNAELRYYLARLARFPVSQKP